MFRTVLAACLLSAPSLAQLPPVPEPPENRITPEKAILGKLLFWEEQLSSNNRVACGTCHTFGAGGGDERVSRHPGPGGTFNDGDDIFASAGVRRANANNEYVPDSAFGHGVQVTARTSPSFLSGAWFAELMWDGRATSQFVDPQTGQVAIASGGALESQAIGPILNNVEMAHDGRPWAEVTSKLASVEPMALATNLPGDMAAAVANGRTYPDLFQAAFGTPTISARRIAFAIATYERTLVADQTPWDQFMRGQSNAMTQNQIQGMAIFNGFAGCSNCHSGPLFSDQSYRNLGIRPVSEDPGRQAITGNFQDRGSSKCRACAKLACDRASCTTAA